ncbi:MAG TPA: serine/threonine-protein kinase [Terracidiphilus sp.]|nr:serine/threonine-protein kinase [Terracidiphilus sp.]
MTSPKLIGRYEVLEELGHGAMGSVLKANDPSMGRTVAVKTILTSALESHKGEEYRMRFYREARAAGSLAHPGIVPVFDVGEDEGTPYLVMEYVEGRTLATAARSGERFTLDRVCELGQQIAEALGYAHKKGVIHRDIKPANILMTSPEVYGSERPRITDFGVAKMAVGEVTTTGQLLGTPAFMPPEQFTGSPVDGRADLFSLGVILYALATGEQPFHGETMTAVSYKVVHTDPVPPGRFNPSMPPQLEAAILKCLAKNPADRFQTGEELAGALAALRAAPEATALGTAMRTSVITTLGDTEATLDESAAGLSVRQTAPVQLVAVPVQMAAARQEPAPVVVRRRAAIGPVAGAMAAVVVVALAVGGWWFARHRSVAAQPAAQQGGGPVAAAAAPAADEGTNTSDAVAAPVATAAAAPAAAAPAATVPRPKAAAASVGFDPKTLDPKTSAKLKIELSRIPDGTAFTVEMNRKVYLNGVAGNKSTFENVLVPPGVQEFRVTMKAGGQRRESNIVSDDFKAKKRKTLKIELNGLGPGGAPARDTQVFVALK